MSSARALKDQIEAVLATKIPAALSPAPRILRDFAPTGIAGLDSFLGGGLPSAAITELVGPSGSGRTTIALAYLSRLTQAGSVCAWIDVADALDPACAAANGIRLEWLLWVRCGRQQRTAAEVSEAGQTEASPRGSSASPSRPGGGGSPHPRSEGRDMPEAIRAMLNAHGGLYDQQLRREKRSIGTPGAPNRPVSYGRSGDREEQVTSDRLPARRGDQVALAARCAEPQPRRRPQQPARERLMAPRTGFSSARGNSPGDRLDQALRVADLLLQSGGFSAIVLDLGGIAPEMAWRIPLATWFRFRAACERSRISLLLLTQHPCARSSAELVVRLEAGSMEADGNVMTGIRYCAAMERSRQHESAARVVSIRKPPQSEKPGAWKSGVAWAQ